MSSEQQVQAERAGADEQVRLVRDGHELGGSEAQQVSAGEPGEAKKLSEEGGQKWKELTSLQLNSKKANVQAKFELNQEERKRRWRVLDPSGALYHHWSMVVSLAFLYNFWSLSYRFAFREIDLESVAFWFALDYSADLIYLLDVLINLRTGYLEEGVLERKLEKIGQHYRDCTLFYLDCLCLLPLDVLYLSIGFNSILRCTRLVKIYKFWSYVDRTERHTNYPNVFRTFTLVHYILVIFHWNACLFHMISKSKLIDIEELYRINDNRCYDILCQYLHAFYWSTLALTTIGDLPRPRTKGEYLYVTVELFFGLFLFASVLGHVANIVTNVSAARKEFQAKLDAVKTFMRMRRVSDELQIKVIRWFDYLWISQKASDEERSVACLPDRLKAEIAIHVHLDTLKRVDIFQNTEAGFLCELVLRLKPVLFSPGDYVCRKNEVGHEMYIVSRGILEVVSEENKMVVVATLKAGSYFGEISVLNVGLAGNKRTASVRSVGYSDLFCLNKQDLWDVLKNYPNAEARIRARAEERLSKLDIGGQQRPHSGSAHRRRVCSSGSSRYRHAHTSRFFGLHPNNLCCPQTPVPTCCRSTHKSATTDWRNDSFRSTFVANWRSLEQPADAYTDPAQAAEWSAGESLSSEGARAESPPRAPDDSLGPFEPDRGRTSGRKHLQSGRANPGNSQAKRLSSGSVNSSSISNLNYAATSQQKVALARVPCQRHSIEAPEWAPVAHCSRRRSQNRRRRPNPHRAAHCCQLQSADAHLAPALWLPSGSGSARLAPIIQVPLLATPTGDGNYQMIESLSMSQLGLGNESQPKLLFVGGQQVQLSKSSQSIRSGTQNTSANPEQTELDALLIRRSSLEAKLESSKKEEADD